MADYGNGQVSLFDLTTCEKTLCEQDFNCKLPTPNGVTTEKTDNNDFWWGKVESFKEQGAQIEGKFTVSTDFEITSVTGL